MMRILALLGLVALTSSLSLSFSSSSSSFTGKSFSSPQVTPPSATSPTTMKLFDWKRREADESLINDMENTYLTLTNLKPAPGSKHRKSRKGRGIAAGQGASCGFGMRGQKSRSGSGVRPGFEGGQQPLYRRLPKWPGRTMGPGHKRTIYNIIKTDELNSCKEGDVVNYSNLLYNGQITKAKAILPHKVVLGKTPFEVKGLTVQAQAFTKSARAAIEEAGGKCDVLSATTGELVEEMAIGRGGN